MLDVTVWRQRESMTVHLVNLTNPMMMKGPLREIIPVGPERVRIRLPAGTRAGNVRLLTARTTPPSNERTTACSSSRSRRSGCMRSLLLICDAALGSRL